MDESLRNLIDIESKLTAQKDVLERIKIRTSNGRKFVNIIDILSYFWLNYSFILINYQFLFFFFFLIE